jgi:hypothetical protein
VFGQPCRDLVGAELATLDSESGVRFGFWRGQRRVETFAQYPELERVEDPVDRFTIPLAKVQIVRADRERHIADQLGQLPVAQHGGEVVAQQAAGLAWDLVDPIDEGRQ